MPAHKSIRVPQWLTLLAALVAAIVIFFVFVQRGEATQVANEHSYEPKIISGTAVPNGKYSFVAALLNTSYGRAPFYQQFCGGSLIDQDSVLTAAHCVTGFGDLPVLPRPLRITVGRTVLNSDQGQKSWVSRIFVHPRYNGDTLTYDAAVLKLSSPVSGIAPIKLPNSKQNYLEKSGRKAMVAGWGSTTARRACLPTFASPVFPYRMRQAQVPIVSDSRADQLYQDICRFIGPSYSHYIPRLMVAAGGTGKDACQGDSGGPLFVARAPDGNGDNDGKNGDGDNGTSGAKYTQIGITSFGPGCGTERYPGAYTEVNASPIARFIKRAASQ
jgi:secreted trypsin-like serine protease